MSNTAKIWTAVVVVIILIVIAWIIWGGSATPSPAPSPSPTVEATTPAPSASPSVLNTSPDDTSDAALQDDLSVLDRDMNALSADLTAAGNIIDNPPSSPSAGL